MTEEQQNLAADDAEATLVAPRFDETAEETAQPVVPLDEKAVSKTPAFYSPQRFASPARPSWLLALIVASLLVGTVLGGLGLRLYQSRRNAAAPAQPTREADANVQAQTQAAPVANQPDQAATESQQPIVENDDAANAQEASQTSAEPVAQNDATAHANAARSEAREGRATDEAGKHDDAAKRHEETAAPRRNAQTDAPRRASSTDERASDDTMRREQGGGALEEREEMRPRRAEDVKERRRQMRQEAEYDVDQQPRLMGRIKYGKRGARADRQRQAGTVDRVRGIFEGQSPQ